MENLSQSLRLAEEKKEINTYTIGGAKSMTHLLFVDNILCFTRANRKSFTTINNVVDEFSSFSSLQMNARKSLIIFLVACLGQWEEL